MIRACLRLLPTSIRASAFYRLFFSGAQKRKKLFTKAPLEFAPGIKMNLSPQDTCHQLIAYTGFFELHLSEKFSHLASLGGEFVDVGANYGYYSLLWAAADPGNIVTAFEAVPENASMLEENAQLNDMSKRIKIYNKALGRKRERMSFDLVEDTQTTWGGLTHSKEKGFELEVVPLDEIWNKEKLIELLKIDVEGAEVWVLEGAANLLKTSRIRNIFFEENLDRQEKLNIAPGSAIKLLEQLGYQVVQLNKNESLVSEYHAFLT